eukprot:m.207372 g.207372  ORF g.207372 m.207372 type:complete len:599 (+) comp32984_c0_seq1:161-1957(+)
MAKNRSAFHLPGSLTEPRLNSWGDSVLNHIRECGKTDRGVVVLSIRIVLVQPAIDTKAPGIIKAVAEEQFTWLREWVTPRFANTANFPRAKFGGISFDHTQIEHLEEYCDDWLGTKVSEKGEMTATHAIIASAPLIYRESILAIIKSHRARKFVSLQYIADLEPRLIAITTDVGGDGTSSVQQTPPSLSVQPLQPTAVTNEIIKRVSKSRQTNVSDTPQLSTSTSIVPQSKTTNTPPGTLGALGQLLAKTNSIFATMSTSKTNSTPDIPTPSTIKQEDIAAARTQSGLQAALNEFKLAFKQTPESLLGDGVDLKRSFGKCSSNVEIDAMAKMLLSNICIPKWSGTLILSNNHVKDVGVCKISEALRFNSTVTWLDLQDNSIGDEGAAALSRALFGNITLTTLILRHNKIGNEGVSKIAFALKANRTLSILSFVGNMIGDVGVIQLAKALTRNRTIKSLFLNQNTISDVGAIAMADMLIKNTALVYLGLQENQIGDTGSAKLGVALESNNCLKELHLGKNNIGDVGAQKFWETFQQHQSLEYLSIFGNNISNKSGLQIVQMLKSNSKLTTLHLYNNNIDHEWCEKIVRAWNDRNALLLI